MPSATLTAGSAAGDSASRRWSIAKSVGNASLASSVGHHASLEKQPSLQVDDFLIFFINCKVIYSKYYKLLTQIFNYFIVAEDAE